MKVLWISNIIFPEACSLLKIQCGVVGGWMQSSADALLDTYPDLQLAVISFFKGEKLTIINGKRIRYYLIPNNSTKLHSLYKEIQRDYLPDLVHIHGSEYPHSLRYVEACENKNVVVSIQGLVSVYAKYYLGGISQNNVRTHSTFRDIIRRDSLFQQQKKMRKSGEAEIQLLKSVSHVIGRTSWDKSCVWSINQDIKYHFCNETLRSPFYFLEWKYTRCRPYTLFISQGHYPIKGLHKVFEALPLIKKQFPNTQIRIAGNDFLNVPTYRINGYANYLKTLIKEYNLSDCISFLSPLTAEQMAQEYLHAHVFICPSSIENSPNSVGEAQLIGTPCVASYVGGTMDMIDHGKNGLLYRFEETPLLAMHVCNLFASPQLCETLSTNARNIAQVRHDRIKNAKNLLAIYNNILTEN